MAKQNTETQDSAPVDDVVGDTSFTVDPTSGQVLPVQTREEDVQKRIDAALKEQGLTLPKNEPPMSSERYAAIEAARVRAAAIAAQMDTTVPGGRYIVGGVLVDCDGNRIEE